MNKEDRPFILALRKKLETERRDCPVIDVIFNKLRECQIINASGKSVLEALMHAEIITREKWRGRLSKMKNPKPPLIHDDSGDVRLFDNVMTLLMNTEDQDLSSIENRFVYDSDGHRYVLDFSYEKNDLPHKWDYGYPVILYALNETIAKSELRDLLDENWRGFRKYPELSQPTL